MPKYFFDCFDGMEFHRDQYGIELADDDEAADHGACLVQALMSERIDGVGTRAAAAMVRSASGAQVYAAHCTFHGVKMPDRRQDGSCPGATP